MKIGCFSRLCGVLFVGAILSHPVAAQDTRNYELAGSDRHLNETYQALMRQLLPQDRAALRNSQRLWMAFRDADCSFGWGDRRDCLMQRTDERTEQLRTSTYLDEQGKLIEWND